jgi:Polyketide cyclase / dehydrase and lipid transport
VPDRSRRRPVVTVDVVLDAPARQVWDAVVDWESQTEWMLGTRVRVVGDRTHGLGARVEAVTGVGRLAVVDPMVVTEWEPPHRCVVSHTGPVVRGTGVFEVFGLPDDRSRLVWSEHLDLPGGRLGQLGWPLVRPAMVAGVRLSLSRLSRRVQRSGQQP